MTKAKSISIVATLLAVLVPLTGWCWFFKTPDYSDSERRVLADFPTLTAETVLSGKFMSEFETYATERFPMRDTFRTIKAFSAYNGFLKSDNNKIYFAQGHTSKMEYPLSYDMLDNAAKRFEFIYDTYLKENNPKVYFSIIPDKNNFIADASSHLQIDFAELETYMLSKTSFMEYIKIDDLLSAEDYYNTDTHWRQNKIIDVAQRIAGKMGNPITEGFVENTLDNPFYGVYYGQSAMPLEADTIKYLTNKYTDGAKVTSYTSGTPTKSYMYNMELGFGKDPYELFLSGDEAVIVIENENATADKELVVFRDSFGSSLSPLLTEAYKKITVVDIRYISSSLLDGVVDFECDDVLFIYSTLLLNSSTAFK